MALSQLVRLKTFTAIGVTGRRWRFAFDHELKFKILTTDEQ